MDYLWITPTGRIQNVSIGFHYFLRFIIDRRLPLFFFLVFTGFGFGAPIQGDNAVFLIAAAVDGRWNFGD